MSRCTIFAITLAAMLTSPLPALAHAHLEAASPAADATVTSAPAEVVLDFFEAIEPKFSAIEVEDAHGSTRAMCMSRPATPSTSWSA